jgi:hypothetical protein
MTGLTALLQQQSYHALQQLCNAEQGNDEAFTVFAAYITNIVQGMHISNSTKRMFLCTQVHL